jgi:hypothetical protein
MNKKYYLSVGAIFRNEAHILEEWINHHYQHGVEHFFLINDKSTDRYKEIITKYIEIGLVTLFDLDSTLEVNKQEAAYNHFFCMTKPYTEWLAIIDLDEFIYSSLAIDLKKCIKIYDKYDQILIKGKEFGSSGFIDQPAEVIPNFIQRKTTKFYDSQQEKWREILINPKCIVRTDRVLSYWIHSCSVEGMSVLVDFDIACFNHYKIQSLNFYTKIKLTRGDCQFNDNTRSLELFKDQDYADESDEFLKNQNKDIIFKNLYSNKIFDIPKLLFQYNNFYSGQDYDNALIVGLTLSTIDKLDINSFFLIGNSFLANEKYALAIYFYNLAINLDSNLSSALKNKQYCLYMLLAEAESLYRHSPIEGEILFNYIILNSSQFLSPIVVDQ